MSEPRTLAEIRLKSLVLQIYAAMQDQTVYFERGNPHLAWAINSRVKQTIEDELKNEIETKNKD